MIESFKFPKVSTTSARSGTVLGPPGLGSFWVHRSLSAVNGKAKTTEVVSPLLLEDFSVLNFVRRLLCSRLKERKQINDQLKGKIGGVIIKGCQGVLLRTFFGHLINEGKRNTHTHA